MGSRKTIIVPVDGSEPSSRAIRVAAAIAIAMAARASIASVARSARAVAAASARDGVARPLIPLGIAVEEK
jgi:nucleotide-binding universal stress UspA family protein